MKKNALQPHFANANSIFLNGATWFGFGSKPTAQIYFGSSLLVLTTFLEKHGKQSTARPSHWKQPSVVLVLTVFAAGGLLLLLPTAQAGQPNV